MKVWGAVLAAIALFSLLFAGVSFNFWAQLAISTFLLACMAFFLDRELFNRLKKWNGPFIIVWGLLSAVVLYGVFFAAAVLVKRVLPVGSDQITQVYSLREQASASAIAALLAFVIGPCEEIFWRGYIQHSLAERYGKWTGLCLATLIYGGAHLASGQFMLIIAAVVCGAFWGFLFTIRRSLWLCILSHVVLDVLVFLVLPLPS